MSEDDRDWGWLRGFVTVKGVATWVLGILTTLLVTLVLIPTCAPSINQQLDDVRTDAAEDELRIVKSLRVPNLRGTGSVSHVLVLRSEAVVDYDYDHWVSDEVRVYDEDGGKLKLRLAFKPDNDKAFAPPGKPGTPFLFDVTVAGDLDHNGRAEIIGSYSQLAMQPVMPRPTAIYWDPILERYRLTGLIKSPAKLVKFKQPGLYGANARRAYRRKYRIRDRSSHRSYFSYPAGHVSYTNLDGTPVLLASYVAKAQAHADLPVVQVVGFTLDVSGPQPTSQECSDVGPVLLKKELVGVSPDQALTKAWRRAVQRDQCFYRSTGF